jgi:monoamine oxidase
VFAEISRYGLELTESLGTSETEDVLTVSDGRRVWEPYPTAWPAIESVMERIGSDSRDVLDRPYDPLRRFDDLVSLDKLSIQDRIDETDLTPTERDLANGLWSLFCSAPCHDVGLVTMLRWYALSGWDIATLFDTTARYKIKRGTRALIEAIASDSTAEVRLESVVTAVDHSADAVTVTTRDGHTLRARRVVLTAPLNTLGMIQFSPPPSVAKQRGILEGQASRGCKLWVQVRGRLPRPFFATAPDDGYPINYVHTEEVLEDGQFLVGFGSDSAAIDVNDVGQVQMALRKLLGDVEVVATTGHDWLDDEFSRGTWPMLRPGQFSGLLADLQRPEGQLFFAGSETANGWNGFIDGAIESGFRVSREVIASMRERSETA